MIVESPDEFRIGAVITVMASNVGGPTALARVLRRATFEEYIADVRGEDPEEFEKNAHFYRDDPGLYHYEVSVYGGGRNDDSD